MATSACRSIARLPHHPRPILPRSIALSRPHAVFAPLPRSSIQQRWASSSPLQKLKRPQDMGSSDLFIVLSLLLGVGYVGGSVFGTSGEKKRKAAGEAPAPVEEKRAETPPVVAKKAAEAEETVAAPPPPPPSPAPSSEEASSSGDVLGPDETDDPSQAAFNPDTGEINWDCPCLGGMAHGPCGETFKAAFSCFVYSEQEPKGVECIESFKAMQECFRAHPDVYGDDDAEDEEDGDKDDFVVVDRPESGQPAAAPTPADGPTDAAPPAPAKESE